MDRRIDIDLIIWLVLFLLLFGGSLIKWLIRRLSWKKEEAAPQEKPPSLIEEFKKMIEGVVIEEEPELVIVEERPPRKRLRKSARVKAVVKETLPVIKPISKEEEKPPTLQEAPAPTPYTGLTGQELRKAVIMSEILGPPKANRRHHRLF